MTNKFNVGDKVRILNEVDSQFKIGTIGVIKGCDHSGYREWEVSVNGDSEWFDPDEIELVGPQFTNNQRITALEKEVVHLSKIVNIQGELIGDLIGKLKSFEFVLAEQSKLTSVRSSTERSTALSVTTVEDIPFFVPKPAKTLNQLRTEIIEKAKGFVEKNSISKDDAKTNKYVSVRCRKTYIEFVVNTEKNTIVALAKGLSTHHVISRGISKCMPGDVFNTWIGKAIALGRALGLDVSEFEQAVQPNEVVVGMQVQYLNSEGVFDEHEGEICEVAPPGEYNDNGELTGIDSIFANDSKIINDTNAIYETAVNE